MLADDVQPEICYLGIQKLLQHVKENATNYSSSREEKLPNKGVFH
jgi:hypothetical protein